MTTATNFVLSTFSDCIHDNWDTHTTTSCPTHQAKRYTAVTFTGCQSGPSCSKYVACKVIGCTQT